MPRARSTIRFEGRRVGRTAAAIALLAWAPAAVAAERSVPPPPSVASVPAGQGELEDALWSRLHQIETAFRSQDAAALRTAFATTGKLRVDLSDVAEAPASYGAGQLQVIFGQIFDAWQTREFAFRRQDVTLCSDTAFARGRWVRRQGSAAELTETLTFTLRKEAGDWRIHEILSSR